MSLSEKLCWQVLDMLQGKTVSRSWFKSSDTKEPDFINALPVPVIEYELVLKYKRSEIEDNLYFLHKRGYLIQHGYKGLTRLVFELSDRASEIMETREFTKEEQKAFNEDLIDIKTPGWFGVKFNIGEVWRRTQKRFSRPNKNS